jgi:phosphoribosyl-ATP pyrophosphohydrolase
MAMKLDELYAIVCERRDHPSEKSYTTQLMQAGEDEILKKIGEEAIEVVLAGKGQGDERLVEEVADLAYHALVLLAFRGLTPAAIEQELDRRHRKKTAG